MFRIQLAILAAREQVSQQTLLGEALNLLLESRMSYPDAATVTLRLDPEVMKALDERALAIGISRREFLVERINLGLALDPEAPAETRLAAKRRATW